MCSGLLADGIPLPPEPPHVRRAAAHPPPPLTIQDEDPNDGGWSPRAENIFCLKNMTLMMMMMIIEPLTCTFIAIHFNIKKQHALLMAIINHMKYVSQS